MTVISAVFNNKPTALGRAEKSTRKIEASEQEVRAPSSLPETCWVCP